MKVSFILLFAQSLIGFSTQALALALCPSPVWSSVEKDKAWKAQMSSNGVHWAGLPTGCVGGGQRCYYQVPSLIEKLYLPDRVSIDFPSQVCHESARRLETGQLACSLFSREICCFQVCEHLVLGEEASAGCQDRCLGQAKEFELVRESLDLGKREK